MKSYNSYVIFGAVNTLAGVSGIIAYSIAFANQSRIWIDHFITLHYTITMTVVGLLMIYISLKPKQYIETSFFFVMDLVYYGLLFVSACVSIGGYAAANFWVASAWNFALFPAIGVSIYILVHRRRNKDSGTVSPHDKAQTRRMGCSGTCCCAATISIIKAFHLLFSGFTAAGAVVEGYANSFAPRGKIVNIDDGTRLGNTMNIHYYCIGETDPTYPTIWIVADSAHGVVDFYGLQYYLNQQSGTQNRRVCSYDNIGFGWSSDYVGGTIDTTLWFDNLITASGEQTPLIMIAWGGGGSTISWYAKVHRKKVTALGFVEVFPPGIEFNTYGAYNGLTESETASYRSLQLKGRIVLANMILGTFVPFGFMPLIVPAAQDPTYYPPDRWTEFRVQLWRAKAWITQLAGLLDIQQTLDSQNPLVNVAPLAPIRLVHVLCNLSDVQVCTDSSSSCLYRQFNNQYGYEAQKNMTLALVSNATFVTNSDDDCSLAMPLNKPLLTAQLLWSQLSSVGRFG